MPFLVDSASLTLSEMGLGVHLIIHPVIRVGRNRSGLLTAIYPKHDGQGKAESVMQFQVDRRTDKADMAGIRDRLAAAF